MTSGSDPWGLIRRAAEMPVGVTDGQIRRARERGALTDIARGVYLPADQARSLNSDDLHTVRVAAVLPRLAGSPVVSHVSAAVLHGLPFMHSSAPVHVTRDAAKSRPGPGVHAHRGVLPDDEVVTLGGLAVTSAARTVLDCARVLAFPDAVAVADAALHRELTSLAELRELLDRHPRIPGRRRGVAVVEFADARAATPWESHSRVALAESRAPTPEPGRTIAGSDGAVVGRVAFCWPAQRLVGEERRAPDEAWDEALAEAGYAVISWGWDDLADVARLRWRVFDAFGTGDPSG